MTPFKAGFIKYATDCGLPTPQAVHMFKRASDHPNTQELFKKLADAEIAQNENLELLTNLMQQNAIDKQMHNHAANIQ